MSKTRCLPSTGASGAAARCGRSTRQRRFQFAAALGRVRGGRVLPGASRTSAPNADPEWTSAVVVGRRLFFDGAGTTVVRIDASTGAIRRSRSYNGSPDISRITVANNYLWLTSPTFNQLLQVDPDTLSVTRKTNVGGWPVGVSFGAGSLWVANNSDGTVTRIDPSNGRVDATIRVGGTPYGMTFAHHLAWVTFL